MCGFTSSMTSTNNPAAESKSACQKTSGRLFGSVTIIPLSRNFTVGAHVTLITCTRGEEGEVLVPGLAHLASANQDLLGEHRETELAGAMKALGITQRTR